MIDNLEEVKNQLKELSEVINSFHSEAVQLRIIDLVFNAAPREEVERTISAESRADTSSSRKRIKSKIRALPSERTPKGEGPLSTLARLADSDFFDRPRSIRAIIEYCDAQLAKKIRQSDISGKLAKMVKEGELKREKNAEGQYEYRKP